MTGPRLDHAEPLDASLPRLARPVAPPPEPPTGRLISVREVADMMGYSPRTIRRLASRKRDPLPGMRVTPRSWRFARADVEAWLAARRPRAAA